MILIVSSVQVKKKCSAPPAADLAAGTRDGIDFAV